MFSHSVQPNGSNQVYLEPRKPDTQKLVGNQESETCARHGPVLSFKIIQAIFPVISCFVFLLFLFSYIPNWISYPLKACLGWFNIIFCPLKLAWTFSLPSRCARVTFPVCWSDCDSPSSSSPLVPLPAAECSTSLGPAQLCLVSPSTSAVLQKRQARKYSRNQPLQETTELNKAHKAVQAWKGRSEGWWNRAFGSGVPLALLVLETLKTLLSFMILTWKLWTNPWSVYFKFKDAF